MSPDPSAAIDFWTARLELLDAAITDTSRSKAYRLKYVTARMRTERTHLATLLRLAGVEVKELDEEAAR